MQVTDEETLRRIAYNLRRLRGERSYRQVADLAGTHAANIQQIESQQRMPQAGTLTRLAEGLGVDVNELLIAVPANNLRHSKKNAVNRLT